MISIPVILLLLVYVLILIWPLIRQDEIDDPSDKKPM